MSRQIAPILVWIPKNPAESPEGLSAEINQRLAKPYANRLDLAGPNPTPPSPG